VLGAGGQDHVVRPVAAQVPQLESML
jgi:hypothetical protein